MVKVVVTKLATDVKKRATKKGTSVDSKRIRGKDGHFYTVRTVDAGSRTLTEDLTYVFNSNVAKAREENKRLFGSRERVAKP